MAKYSIKLMPKAYRDLVEIYTHITDASMETQTAQNIVNLLENAILSLDEFPYRGSERRIGAFVKKGYRQMLVKNITILYRIDEEKKHIIIVTVRYLVVSNYDYNKSK